MQGAPLQGEPFVWKGKTLLSGVDPVRRADKTADAISVQDKTLYLCPSPLYGYGLKRFLTRLAQEAPGSAVLCIEADSQLYEISVKNVKPDITADQRLRITNICEGSALCTFAAQAWGGMAFRRVQPLRLTGGWQLYPELYDFLVQTLQKEIATSWSNALTMAKLGWLYIRNAIKNLALIPHFPSIEHLSFGSDPVLVLGAGPSLDETLAGLERFFHGSLQRPEKRPFRIICVDTCLTALRNRDITPDLAVILESQHWNLKGFIGCRGWDVPAAIDLCALPQSGRILCGKKYLFSTTWADLKIFGRLKQAALLPGTVPPLGSVGLCAVELARRLSRGKIITAGIDFCFTLDKNHARCTPVHKNRLTAKTRFTSLLNAAAAFDSASFAAVSKSGRPVYCNPIMRTYRNLFEQEFSGDPRLYTAADGGLHLGIKNISVKEAAAILANNEHYAKKSVSETGQPLMQAAFAEKLKLFLDAEKKRLVTMRNILGGEEQEQGRLKNLIDECDYLWAHFPDYAGGRSPNIAEFSQGKSGGHDSQTISFLKRLRTEIDPVIALMQRISES